MKRVSVVFSTCEHDDASGWVIFFILSPRAGESVQYRGRTPDEQVGESPRDGYLGLTCLGSSPKSSTLDLIFPNR